MAAAEMMMMVTDIMAGIVAEMIRELVETVGIMAETVRDAATMIGTMTAGNVMAMMEVTKKVEDIIEITTVEMMAQVQTMSKVETAAGIRMASKEAVGMIPHGRLRIEETIPLTIVVAHRSIMVVVQMAVNTAAEMMMAALEIGSRSMMPADFTRNRMKIATTRMTIVLSITAEPTTRTAMNIWSSAEMRETHSGPEMERRKELIGTMAVEMIWVIMDVHCQGNRENLAFRINATVVMAME
mmetsp:Transcript_28825/g.69440  ORF Transcript_28825/g.69440 Transcript_28825/m.69440 type:complete len:241 (+) Transcript_28825:1221-1943(+)